jgi:mono/diheme cytochrome c family protein
VMTPPVTMPPVMTPPMTTPPVVTPPPAMTPAPPAPGVTAGIPADVQALLQSRCSACHTYGQADPAGWGAALDRSRLTQADIVVPGHPELSRMIDRVAVAGNMPPTGARLTSDEVNVLKKWIAAMPPPTARPLSDEDVLDAITIDQLALRDRNNDYRYVSFANFLGQERSDEEMTAIRLGISFVLNSLSRKGRVADFPAIDKGQSIFRVRLSDLGWDAQVWDTLTSFYPYCLRSDVAAHLALYDQLKTEAPVVRGDWLVATATKAPLYEFLLDQPNTIDQLASTLDININNDINHPGLDEPDNLVRVGFRRSAVALHNRMIERHLGNAGQYLWITYDFNSDQGRSDLLANPLGPTKRDQQRFVHTFDNAASEVIYTLPNGMQGYMLVNGNGNRLDSQALAVARDPHRRDSVVQNGLSCIGCHSLPGLLRPRQLDEVAAYGDTHIADFLGRELDEIDVTYPRRLMPDILSSDTIRYRANLSGLSTGALPQGDGEYSTFTALLGQYESNLGFHGAANEFGQEFDTFNQAVQANDAQNDAFPRNPAGRLLTRDDFVCEFRDLAPKILRNGQFCSGTFSANAVRNLCK